MVGRYRFDPSRRQGLRLPDGTPVWWRPVVASDRRAFQAYFRQLSDETRFQRFQTPLTELPSSVWDSLLNEVDLNRHVALALHEGDAVIAVCHLVRLDEDWNTADLGVVVADSWQGRGIGHLVVREALRVARDIQRIDTEVVAGNQAAMRLLEGLGPNQVEYYGGTCRVQVDILLSAAA